MIKPFPPEVKTSIMKMRRLQIGLTIVLNGIGLLDLLIAVDVLQPYWFIILLIITLESAGAVLVTVVLIINRLLGRKRRNRSATHDVRLDPVNPLDAVSLVKSQPMPQGVVGNIIISNEVGALPSSSQS